MISLVQFVDGKLAKVTAKDSDLVRAVTTVYQPGLDKYLLAIADYISAWAASSINMVEAGKMDFDRWVAAKDAISPYSTTLNVINSNAVKSSKQQDIISNLRTSIKNTRMQTIPNVDPSWWEQLTGASASALLAPLNALKSVAVSVKNFYESEKKDIANMVADRSAKDILDDPSVKRLITILTYGSVIVAGSLAIWLLTKSRK